MASARQTPVNLTLDVLFNIEREFEKDIKLQKKRYTQEEVIEIYRTSVLNAINRMAIKKEQEFNDLKMIIE